MCPRAWWCWTPCTRFRRSKANDLAVRWNCKAGKCGSCSAEVNGNPRLMCMTRLNQLDLVDAGDASSRCAPFRWSGTWSPTSRGTSQARRASSASSRGRPTRPTARGGWRRSDVERVQEFRKCIECFLCQDVCHVLRDHACSTQFAGPRHLVYAAALEMHPLDTEDRARDLKDTHGIGYCNITKCCTKVCPENITITDNAIIPLKERVDRSALRSGRQAVPYASLAETARGGHHGIPAEDALAGRRSPGRSRRPSATVC